MFPATKTVEMLRNDPLQQQEDIGNKNVNKNNINKSKNDINLNNNNINNNNINNNHIGIKNNIYNINNTDLWWSVMARWFWRHTCNTDIPRGPGWNRSDS